MKNEITKEQIQNLPVSRRCGHLVRTPIKRLDCHNRVRAQLRVSKEHWHEYVLKQFPVGRKLVVAPLLSSWGIPGTQDPGKVNQGSIFLRTKRISRMNGSYLLRRKTVGNNQFHNRESEGDLHDLYNACYSRNGVLDFQKLDELSEDEAEYLNVPRLKELGVHVASGCAECAAIIKTLNWARGALAVAEESCTEKSQAANSNHSDSL